MIFLRILAVLCYVVSVQAELSADEKVRAIDAFCEIVSEFHERATRVQFSDLAADTLVASLENSPYTEEISNNTFVDSGAYDSDQAVTMYFTEWNTDVKKQIENEESFIVKNILSVYRVVGMSAGLCTVNSGKNEASRLFIVFKTVSTVPASSTLKSYVVDQLRSTYSIAKVDRKADVLAVFCATKLANNKTKKLGYKLWRGAKIISTTITNTKETEISGLDKTTLTNLKTTLDSLKTGEKNCTPFGISVGCVCSKGSDSSLLPTCYIAVIVTYRFTALSDANNKQVIDSLNAPELKVSNVLAREVAEARSKILYAGVTDDATKFKVEEAAGVFTFIFASIELGKDFTEMLKKLPLNVIAEKLKKECPLKDVVGSGSAVARLGKARRLVVAVVFKTTIGPWCWTPSIYNSNAEATVNLNPEMKSGWMLGYAETERKNIFIDEWNNYVKTTNGVFLSLSVEYGPILIIHVICSSEGSPYQYVGNDILVVEKKGIMEATQ